MFTMCLSNILFQYKELLILLLSKRRIPDDVISTAMKRPFGGGIFSNYRSSLRRTGRQRATQVGVPDDSTAFRVGHKRDLNAAVVADDRPNLENVETNYDDDDDDDDEQIETDAMTVKRQFGPSIAARPPRGPIREFLKTKRPFGPSVVSRPPRGGQYAIASKRPFGPHVASRPPRRNLESELRRWKSKRPFGSSVASRPPRGIDGDLTHDSKHPFGPSVAARPPRSTESDDDMYWESKRPFGPSIAWRRPRGSKDEFTMASKRPFGPSIASRPPRNMDGELNYDIYWESKRPFGPPMAAIPPRRSEREDNIYWESQRQFASSIAERLSRDVEDELARVSKRPFGSSVIGSRPPRGTEDHESDDNLESNRVFGPSIASRPSRGTNGDLSTAGELKNPPPVPPSAAATVPSPSPSPLPRSKRPAFGGGIFAKVRENGVGGVRGGHGLVAYGGGAPRNLLRRSRRETSFDRSTPPNLGEVERLPDDRFTSPERFWHRYVDRRTASVAPNLRRRHDDDDDEDDHRPSADSGRRRPHMDYDIRRGVDRVVDGRSDRRSIDEDDNDDDDYEDFDVVRYHRRRRNSNSDDDEDDEVDDDHDDDGARREMLIFDDFETDHENAKERMSTMPFRTSDARRRRQRHYVDALRSLLKLGRRHSGRRHKLHDDVDFRSLAEVSPVDDDDDGHVDVDKRPFGNKSHRWDFRVERAHGPS